eukprot:7348663-Pyramimonas_sp.AAC.1
MSWRIKAKNEMRLQYYNRLSPVPKGPVSFPALSNELTKGSLGCRVHPCRYWHRRTRKVKSSYFYGN